MNSSLEGLGGSELLAATHALIRHGRAVEADRLRHLGEVDVRRLYLEEACTSMFVYCVRVLHFSEAAAYKRLPLAGIHWVIVGGESGPGARRVQPEWARAIRDRCQERDVPFFFKQWGGVWKKRTGRVLDGRTWDEWPPNEMT